MTAQKLVALIIHTAAMLEMLLTEVRSENIYCLCAASKDVKSCLALHEEGIMDVSMSCLYTYHHVKPLVNL